MHGIEREVHAGGDQHRRRYRRDRSDQALLRAAAVQLALEGSRVADEEVLERRTPAKGTPLLEAEGGEDRDDVHSRRNFRLTVAGRLRVSLMS